ncbi:MAG: Hsp33 family molecular chaperone HslO [Synergistaceae bacterium]|jgi:molecular chaperone Hsp33|nr:Hsp33 family molecular chaperone HslO [Synergistaceae bacterium]
MKNETTRNSDSQALVVRALIGGEQARLLAVEARSLVTVLKKLHGLSGTATAALGRLSMASLLMADDMKKTGRARVTLAVDGGGPLGRIVADAESSGQMRGFVQNPHVEPEPKGPGKWDVAAAVGSTGTLTVIRDLGLREPVTGQVPLLSGEIAEDVAAYYVRSEQIRTALALGVLEHEGEVVAAGGIMVQLFPDTTDAFADEVERRFREMPPVSTLFFEEGEAMTVVERFASGLEVFWLGSQDYRFGCRCDRAVAADGLLAALGSEAVAESQEVCCHFCNTSYLFSPQEIETLRKERRS